jgi:hypothetical protein
VASGVLFDLNANGKPERLAWTAPNSDNSFLALDRNGNGTIDSGAELFGNATAQASSWQPNGFAALAEFDRAASGGNGDGQITSADAVFSRLLLWRDSNHDGISQAGELYPAGQIGVTAISLNYKVSARRDRYGNLFRYRSKVLGLSGQPFAFDVILQRG